MFCDEVTVTFIAGRGGKGCIGFRREKFVPRGGPNGGDGGDGGGIYLEANPNINTLAEFNTYKTFRAKPGEQGGGKDCGGRDAEDLIMPVPVGTIIFDEHKKNLLGDLTKPGDRFLVARGGRGGYGNAHFKSSTRQAPSFAELGEPGEERKITLELKLVADVGIIGLPSVGKSTLISRISNARPKIADYHFTTLVPNLGLVTLTQFGGNIQQSFLACDLPGLIEDAHKGKGLGIKFLKHVARNRVLVHLLDATSLDPNKDYVTINKELKMFDRSLGKKSQIVVFNKTDAVDGDTLKKQLSLFKRKHRTVKKIFTISCVTGAGLKELLFAIWEVLENEKKAEAAAVETASEKTEFKVFRPVEENTRRITVTRLKSEEKGKRIFEIKGRRLEQIAVMTDASNPEALARLYDVIEKMHAVQELKHAGARFGDEMRIGKQKLIFRWKVE